MSVTIVSHGAIVISGQGATLSPAEHGILAWTDQDSFDTDVSIKLAGSNFMVPQAAILFSPRGGIDTSGSDDSEQCIQLIGQGPIRVPGSKNIFGPGSAACTAQPPNVSVSKTPDGQTINAGQPATFAITVTDSDGDPASTSLVITIADDMPIARNDSATQSPENAPIAVNVIANDTRGADGVNLTTGVALVAGSLTGTGSVAYDNNGTFTYTPGAGEEGTVTFQYRITDGDGDPSVATVTITLAPDSTPTVLVAAGSDTNVDEAALAIGSNPAS